MRKDIEITGIIAENCKVENLKTLLESAGVSQVIIKSIPQYDDWLENLPKENIPGLSDECLDWIRHWCNGGGDESSKTLITDAIKNLNSDMPSELADAIFNSVTDYSKTEYEAKSLTITIIEQGIEAF